MFRRLILFRRWNFSLNYSWDIFPKVRKVEKFHKSSPKKSVSHVFMWLYGIWKLPEDKIPMESLESYQTSDWVKAFTVSLRSTEPLPTKRKFSVKIYTTYFQYMYTLYNRTSPSEFPGTELYLNGWVMSLEWPDKMVQMAVRPSVLPSGDILCSYISSTISEPIILRLSRMIVDMGPHNRSVIGFAISGDVTQKWSQSAPW